MSIAALIVAAGRGVRSGQGVPKQYQLLAGKSVLGRAIDLFLRHPNVDNVFVVIHPDDGDRFQGTITSLRSDKPVMTAFGGATRQESVRLGLEALAPLEPEIVLIHDAARPFASDTLIDRAIKAATQWSAAVPVVPLADSLVRVQPDGRIADGVDRAATRALQTPQAFRFAPLIAAHRAAAKSGGDALPDDSAVMRAAGHSVRVFDGESGNVKLTWPSDFAEAEQRLGAKLIARVASGYDVHAFGPGDHVWLGGIRIEHDQGLVGHSDADAALHALTDALLGAAADGDIGAHFPPSDPQWRGAPSAHFLAFAANRVHDLGGVIDHLDLTIVCEAPKIGAHRERMRERIAEITGVSLAGVSVKATTSERLGFIGRREGLSAFATATTRFPERDAA